MKTKKVFVILIFFILPINLISGSPRSRGDSQFESVVLENQKSPVCSNKIKVDISDSKKKIIFTNLDTKQNIEILFSLQQIDLAKIYVQNGLGSASSDLLPKKKIKFKKVKLNLEGINDFLSYLQQESQLYTSEKVDIILLDKKILEAVNKTRGCPGKTQNGFSVRLDNNIYIIVFDYGVKNVPDEYKEKFGDVHVFLLGVGYLRFLEQTKNVSIDKDIEENYINNAAIKLFRSVKVKP